MCAYAYDCALTSMQKSNSWTHWGCVRFLPDFGHVPTVDNEFSDRGDKSAESAARKLQTCVLRNRGTQCPCSSLKYVTSALSTYSP